MPRRNQKHLRLMLLDFMVGKLTIKDIEAYWGCGTARAYQLVNQLAHRTVGNYRCRDYKLIAHRLAQNEMRVRRYSPCPEDTPEGFFNYEIDHRSHPSVL